jgi:hypothetical protein
MQRRSIVGAAAPGRRRRRPPCGCVGGARAGHAAAVAACAGTGAVVAATWATGPDLGLLGCGCSSAPWRLWRVTGGPGRPAFRARWWGLVDLRPAWLPYAGAAAPGQGVVASFFGSVGSVEDGGGRLHSGEVGSQVSGNIAWQGRWCVWMRRMSTDSEGAGSQLRKKFMFLLGRNRRWRRLWVSWPCWTHCRGVCASIFRGFYSGGKPKILKIRRWRRLFVSFSSLVASSRSRLCLGTSDGELVAKVAGQGCCDSFAMMMLRVDFGSQMWLCPMWSCSMMTLMHLYRFFAGST